MLAAHHDRRLAELGSALHIAARGRLGRAAFRLTLAALPFLPPLVAREIAVDAAQFLALPAPPADLGAFVRRRGAEAGLEGREAVCFEERMQDVWREVVA